MKAVFDSLPQTGRVGMTSSLNWVPVAMAVASVAGSAMQASAQKKAAQAAAGAGRESTFEDMMQGRADLRQAYDAAREERRPFIESGQKALGLVWEMVERGEELSPAQERALDRALQKSQQFAALGNFGGLGSGALAEIQANIALDPQLQNLAKADAAKQMLLNQGAQFSQQQAASEEALGSSLANIISMSAPAMASFAGQQAAAGPAGRAAFAGSIPGIVKGGFDMYSELQKQQQPQSQAVYGKPTYGVNFGLGSKIAGFGGNRQASNSVPAGSAWNNMIAAGAK